MKTNRRTIRPETTFGDEVLHGINSLLDSIKRGDPITIREVTLDKAQSAERTAKNSLNPRPVSCR